MTAATFPTFDQYAASIAKNGFAVLPIYANKKRPIPNDWVNYEYHADDPQRFGDAGIGILTRLTPTIDADVRNVDCAGEIEMLVRTTIGRTPKRIGAAPKAAYMCQLAGDPFKKIQTRNYRFGDDPPDAKAHKVEILADGQQIVAYNIHENTGRPYTWNGGGNPLSVAADLLPPLSEAAARAFIAKADAILAKYGTPIPTLTQADSGRLHVANEKLLATDPKQLREALAAIPNQDLDYDDWVHIGHAVKGALGVAGRDDFAAWSAQSAKDDPQATIAKWDSFNPQRVGAGTIFYLAKRNGWSPSPPPERMPDAFYEALAPVVPQNFRDQPQPIPQTDNSYIELLTLDQFVQRPSTSSYVSGVIPANSIIVVFGPPKGGKTYSVCDLTMHAAHGIDWHGCKVANRLKVAYCIGEGVTGFKVRLKAWQEYHDNIGEPGEFRIIPRGMSLPANAMAIVERLRPFAPGLVVADTVNAYFGGGDENATQDMTAFCDAVRYVRDQLACSVLVIQHTGHADSGRERGSIVLRASADVLIQVAKDETAGELVGFQVILARDMETMETAIPLKLARHETSWLDDDGVPMVACIVKAGQQPVTLPGRGGKALGKVQALVLAAAHELAEDQMADKDGRVILARLDIAKHLGDAASRAAIHACWESLEQRGMWKRLEPGSISLRVRA